MTQETEIWEEVTGYMGFYVVSDLGRVCSTRTGGTGCRGAGYIMKPGVTSWGYPRVNLTLNGISKNHKVHVLVARAFVPNPDNKPEVNHKNCIKTDNRAVNLEWVTSPENNAHYQAAGRPNHKRS